MEKELKIKQIANELNISDCRFYEGTFPYQKDEELKQAIRKRAIRLKNTPRDKSSILKTIKGVGLRMSFIAGKIGVSQQYVSAMLYDKDKMTSSRLKEIHDIIKDIGNKLLKVSK